MNPFRQNSRKEESVLKRSWIEKKFRIFKVKILVFLRGGRIKKWTCKRCKQFTKTRKSLIEWTLYFDDANYSYYWDCRLCGYTHWLN